MATKQAEKSAYTKAKLLTSARTLFREKGYEETTIADIASAAGYAVGTFYRHFTAKTDIAEELYHDIAYTSARMDQQEMFQHCSTVYDALEFILERYTNPSSLNQEVTALYYVLLYSKVSCARPESISVFSDSLLKFLRQTLPSAPEDALKTYSDLMVALLNSYWISSTSADSSPMKIEIVRNALFSIADACIQQYS